MNKEQLEKYGNEPATACVGYGNMGDSFYQSGITIREHFAGLAMQGFMSSGISLYQNGSSCHEYYSKLSVEMADSLLKALAEKREKLNGR